MEGVGGITFSPSTSFKNNAPAYSCFLRAMETWRCGTNINFTIAPSASTFNSSARDGINLITFDDFKPLPTGVLGVTTSYYDFCPESEFVFVSEIDFTFDTILVVVGILDQIQQRVVELIFNQLQLTKWVTPINLPMSMTIKK